MNKLDNISENEIRVIGSNQEPQKETEKKNKWFITVLFVVALLIIGTAIWLLSGKSKNSELNSVSEQRNESPSVTTTPPSEDKAYVVISDTIINNVSPHRFIPVNAKPKLEVGVIKNIPTQYVLGAMAADFGIYDGKYQVVGGFVHHGEMLSHSKSKYGFCAILKDTIAIGNSLSTSYFEQAIEEKGDFFRQYALVNNGEIISNPLTHNDALRRSLCRLNDGRLCIIDTDMSVSLDSFSTALRQYGVVDAIALMGSGAAVRWAVDKAGRRYIAGADEYDFPDVVNYIVWKKTRKE